MRFKRLRVLLLEQLEHSLPPGRHVVFPDAQSASATQHCQLSAHAPTPLVQLSQLGIGKPKIADRHHVQLVDDVFPVFSQHVPPL